MRVFVIGLGLALAASFCGPSAVVAEVPTYEAEVVRAYPHDPQAFTEGLFYLGGFIYEATGLEGRSHVRKEELATGKALQSLDLPAQYFGEGIVAWKNRLLELTWRSHIGFIYDLKTFKLLGSFPYAGEGWALTQNGREIIMSDGTPQLRFLDPVTLKTTHTLTVTAEGAPVQNLNEIEWVKGQILANIWLTNRIARIDPESGKVVGWIDLSRLPDAGLVRRDRDAVPNGIAYDAGRDRLFVTGKLWPRLYEIRLVKKSEEGRAHNGR
jgi:glutamine cyclotransferase